MGGGFASGALWRSVVSCAQGDWLECPQTTNVKDKASTMLHRSNSLARCATYACNMIHATELILVVFYFFSYFVSLARPIFGSAISRILAPVSPSSAALVTKALNACI